MEAFLLFSATFAFYCLGVKAAARFSGRLSLTWVSSAIFAVIAIIVSALLTLSPLSNVSVGPTTLGTLLIIPVVLGTGAWYLRRRLLLPDGTPAGWLRCVRVAAAPFLLVALIGLVAAILLPLVSR
jgi:hypothetical protein